jgi:hypothetical protein
MWIEIYFSVLEKTQVVEIYSFCKEERTRYCLGQRNLWIFRTLMGPAPRSYPSGRSRPCGLFSL